MASNSTVVSTTPSSSVVTTSSIVPSSSSSSSSTTPSVSTTTVTPTPVDTTTTVSASSIPASTHLITSIITQTPTPGETSAVTVVITTEAPATTSTGATTTSSGATSSSSSPASLQNQGSSHGSGGLSTGGKTAIAVVVPVAAVALLVLAALFFWRKRKQRKTAEEARRKEVEEYGYNPNSQPTLPALATDGQSEMVEDSAGGYRGWGAGRSNRNASTTLSAGHTQGQPSDTGSNPGGFSTSPTAFGGSDGQASDMYKQRDTMNSDDLAALGTAPAVKQRSDMRRGPSNASSSYSAGHHSDHSEPSITQEPTNESASSPQGYGYGQPGPYGDGSYGGGDGMPVVRDVSARRNTRIEQGGTYQQGNSGIAQNF